MAIFGWNGFSALAIYVGLVGALYGTKDAGLGKGYYKIQQILNRKGALDEKDAVKKKAIFARLRQARLDAAKGTERYKELASDPDFAKSFGEKQWVR